MASWLLIPILLLGFYFEFALFKFSTVVFLYCNPRQVSQLPAARTLQNRCHGIKITARPKDPEHVFQRDVIVTVNSNSLPGFCFEVCLALGI